MASVLTSLKIIFSNYFWIHPSNLTASEWSNSQRHEFVQNWMHMTQPLFGIVKMHCICLFPNFTLLSKSLLSKLPDFRLNQSKSQLYSGVE